MQTHINQMSKPGMIVEIEGKEFITVGQTQWRSGNRVIIADLVMENIPMGNTAEIRDLKTIVRAVEIPGMRPQPISSEPVIPKKPNREQRRARQ